MILIGIIEFARFFYTHNALTDAARRGARYAVLHPQASRDCVKNIVAYGETHVDPDTCAPSGPALVTGLDPTDVTVTYAGVGTDPFGMNVGSATVTIDYSFTIRLPLWSRTIRLPSYTTTLSAESAGTKPTDI
jgi:Flp pilus assembly protein TadG